MGIVDTTKKIAYEYLAKGTDLSGFTQAELDRIAWQLNTRPRKSLDWECPAELFMPEFLDFFAHHHQLVALRQCCVSNLTLACKGFDLFMQNAIPVVWFSSLLSEVSKMTFSESIKACFSKYAEFSGRADRSEFWWFELFLILLIVGAGMLGNTVSNLISLAVLLPSLAVGARRLHDVSKSGWWQLLYLIPIVGWLVVVYWSAQSTREPNRF